MPQFILDTDGEVTIESPVQIIKTFDDLDAFTQGYIECLFFTNTGCGDSVEWATPEYQHRMAEGQTDGELPNDVGFADLAPDALAEIIEECANFQRDAAELLADSYGKEVDKGYIYDETRAGHDFWYTRNGHGTGFWDRTGLEHGDALAELCGWRTNYTEVNPYFHEGKVYHG